MDINEENSFVTQVNILDDRPLETELLSPVFSRSPKISDRLYQHGINPISPVKIKKSRFNE